jgi:ketosteroid isomerase-like protein
VAYEIGRNIVRVRTVDGSSIDIPGKSLCIFRREDDGVWRADVDIFNSINS